MESDFVYSLPFNKNTKYLAISDPRAHYGRVKHAVDFKIDFNQEILAPLDGEVWQVKDDATEGGEGDKYTAWQYQNLITLKHSDNEYSQYVHLAHKSSLVKEGDKVKRGQPISKGIGMVGCTTAPHLHMMVFKILNEESNEFESKKINFDTEFKVIRNN